MFLLLEPMSLRHGADSVGFPHAQPRRTMNELALFAGVGGGILGGKLLGWRTICAVEWEAYPASVLCARQNEGLLPPFPIWSDICSFDGKPWRGIVDIISGGFPCTDISIAGKGEGLDGDDSSMWYEMARVVSEVRPRFVFVENSPMLTLRGGVRVIADLTSMGYDTKWMVMGAADVGAPHQRDRIWILATDPNYEPRCPEQEREHQRTQKPWRGSQWTMESSVPYPDSQSDAMRGDSQDYEEGLAKRGVHARGSVSSSGERCEEGTGQSPDDANTQRMGWQARTDVQGVDGDRETPNFFGDLCETQSGKTISNSSSVRLEGQRTEQQATGIVGGGEMGDTESSGFPPRADGQGQGQPWRASIGSAQWWETEPPVGRVAHGLPDRVDRLIGCGNGQVPLCAATAWRILNDFTRR